MSSLMGCASHERKLKVAESKLAKIQSKIPKAEMEKRKEIFEARMQLAKIKLDDERSSRELVELKERKLIEINNEIKKTENFIEQQNKKKEIEIAKKNKAQKTLSKPSRPSWIISDAREKTKARRIITTVSSRLEKIDQTTRNLVNQKNKLILEKELLLNKSSNLVDYRSYLNNEIMDIENKIIQLRNLYKNTEEAKLITTITTLKNKILVEDYPTFPDSIPLASRTYKLEENIFLNMSTFGYTKKFLDQILSDCGYEERSYYQVKSKKSNSLSGYAIVAQMEQTDKDAYSLPLPARWKTKFNTQNNFSLESIMNALFGENPGFYRVVVFLVSEEPFVQSIIRMNPEDANILVARGASDLDRDISNNLFSSSDYKCTLLIYEFEIPESGREAFLRVPSPHTGEIHLDRSGLKKAIMNRQN